jgi:hypothetical protein
VMKMDGRIDFQWRRYVLMFTLQSISNRIGLAKEFEWRWRRR